MFSKPLVFSFTLLASVSANLAKGPQPDKSCAEFDYNKLSLREIGQKNTLDWRLWLLHKDEPISFWHDVPLYPDETNKQIVNFVVEIPRWTDGKIETKRTEPLNPIFHDDKDGVPRFVESVWPHKTYPFLYGSIPQTWENSNINQAITGLPGDNDPIDIFDIGQDSGYTGQVKQVKLLGGLAMIDDDTTDWKMVAIDIKDPLAALVNSYEDVEKYRPGTMEAFHQWFIYYKVAKGNGVNTIIGNKYQNASFIIDVVQESHGWWKDLVSGKEKPGKIYLNQTSQTDLKSWVNCKDAQKELGIPKKSDKPQEAAAKPEKYNWWYYLDSNYEVIEVPSLS